MTPPPLELVLVGVVAREYEEALSHMAVAGSLVHRSGRRLLVQLKRSLAPKCKYGASF